MSLSDSSRPLFQWYDKYVGEAASRREVYGYWTFLLGYAVGIFGVLVYLLGLGGEDLFLLVREVAIVTSALGLTFTLLGIVLQLPITRQAVWVALAGTVVSVLGVAYFATVYPSNWLGPASPQRAVIGVYITGVGILAGVAVLVPVLTGERGFLLDRELEDDSQAILVGEAERGGLFAIYRRGPADWRWRLLEQSAVADGVEGFASRPDVESTVEGVKSKIREAGMLEIKHAAFRLYGEEGAWQWILMEEDGSAVAASAGEFSDRDAVEGSVSLVKEFGAEAVLLDIEGAAFEYSRTGPDWTWELLDEQRRPLAVAPEPLDDRVDLDDAADRLRDAAGEADTLALDHLGFEVTRDGDDWGWRLLDRTGQTLARATTADGSREAVRDRVDGIRDRAADAPVTAETEPGFELVSDGPDAWSWRLTDDGGDVVATSHAEKREDDAREDIDGFQENAADAGVVEGEDAAFEVYRADEGWRWRLVDEDRTVIEEGLDAYESREAVEEAVEHVVEQTDVAELVEFEEAAFQLYEAEGGDWRWRLIDEGGEVMTDSGEDFDSREDAASNMTVIKEHAPDAELLEIESAAVELFRSEGGDWGWRLVDEAGETIAECGSLHDSKGAAKDAVGTMRALVEAAETRQIGDGAFQLYERSDGDGAAWHWRFVGADGGVRAEGASGHTTREGVTDAVEDARSAAPGAETHAIEAVAFTLADGDAGWTWRLVDADRETLAESAETVDDRAAAASTVSTVQSHAADAEVFELGGPVYHVRERADGDWEWVLVDGEWTPVASAPVAYAEREGAEAAVETVREFAPDAGLIEYDNAAYEVVTDEDGWRWRLIDEEGDAHAVSAADYERREAAREAVENVRGMVADASLLEIETASFELHESDEGWRWRLVDQRGNTVARSVRSYPTRTGAREGMQSLKDHGPEAGLVVAG